MRVAFANEGFRRGQHLGAFGFHAKALVNQNAYRNGNIIMSEHRDRLRLAILEHGKVVLGEVRNEAASAILHAYVEHDKADITPHGEFRLVMLFFRAKTW